MTPSDPIPGRAEGPSSEPTLSNTSGGGLGTPSLAAHHPESAPAQSVPRSDTRSDAVPPAPAPQAWPKAHAPAPAAPMSPAAPVARRPTPWMAGLALLLAALSFAFAGFQWQKLNTTRQELARRSQTNQAQTDEARAVAGQAEALTKELQARLAVAELRLSEVSLQRSQLEELMLSLSRSRDDNLVQDLESALRLAQQQAALTGSAQPLLAALQSANERIARAAQPRLNPVQRAIERDVERIRASTLADLPSLVMRLDDLARAVDQWPVVNEVGPMGLASEPSARGSPDPLDAQQAGTTDINTANTNDDPAAPGQAGWAHVVERWSSLWRQAWDSVVRSSRDLVRVSRIDQPEAALLAPEQAFFLRENVKLKLLNARLGLLARQTESVQADVQSVQGSLSRYFNVKAPPVVQAQSVLAALREELGSADLPRPDEALAALAVAAEGR